MNKVIPDDAVLIPEQAACVFQGKIFAVYQWPQPLFDGSEHTFEMLKRTDTVTAICVVDDKILVIDDEQPHMGVRRSFPGGRVDPEDTTAQAAAEREIREETGYSFRQWRLIKVSQPYRKIEWFVSVWLAWDVTAQATPHLDPGEKIQLHRLDLTKVKQLIDQRVGYLGESAPIFEAINTYKDLLALPAFIGHEVDR